MSANEHQHQDVAAVEAQLHEMAVDDAVSQTTETVTDDAVDQDVEQSVEQNVEQNDDEQQDTPAVPDFPFTQNVTLPQALITCGVIITEQNSDYAFELVSAAIESVSPNPLPPPLIPVTHDLTVAKTKIKGVVPVTALTALGIAGKAVVLPYNACARCLSVLPLVLGPRACYNCQSVEYCSPKCQDLDWLAHKSMYCIRPGIISDSRLNKPTMVSSFKTHIVNPFTRLSKGIWLHDRHKNDVYVLLIDSFRLREDDDFRYGSMISNESVYNGRGNSYPVFRRYLDQAESKKLLPPWWSAEKRAECDKLGLDRSSNNYHDLHTMTRDTEIFLVYSDPIMIMQMRMFAESVYGRGPAGTDGQLLKQKMVVAETKAHAALKK